MKISLSKTIQIILWSSGFFILFYTYYYLPSQNEGSIKTETKEEVKTVDEIKFKNTFVNTEYISTDKEGKKYITKAEESTIFQKNPELIYLKNPHSYTNLKKDNSLIEIRSSKGIVEKKKNETIYENKVIISNKSYVITSKIAKHIASKNLIIIDGNVIMKDLTGGLTHVIYCDTVEILTTTNNVIAYMKDKNKKVIAKKFK